jgi:hypothetical protein
MADAQPLNATFFAFRKRERSGVLLGATLAYVAIAAVIYGAFVWLNWRAVLDYIEWTVSMSRAGGEVDPNDPFASVMPPASVMSLIGWYFLLIVVAYLLLAAYEAACLRWMIRGETRGLFGLALDADTLRVYLTYWLWFLLFLAAYMVTIMVAFGLIAGAAVSAQGNPDALGPAGLVAFLIVLGFLLLLIFFGVRFAPAAATSIALRRFAFFDAWTVSKGRFWALLGAFVLLWLMYFVGVIVFAGVAVFAMGAGLIGVAQTGAEPASPEEAFALLSSPGVWVPLALIYGVMIAGVFVFYIALFGVNARAALAALDEGKIKLAT